MVLLAAAVAAGWRLTGGRWFVVLTPSMGRAAPVGTLLLTRPVTMAQVRVGELITFRAPTSGEVFSHRVVAITAAGLRTRGDINGVTDPWTVTGRNLVGRVVARWWDVGWLLRALPLLLAGGLVVWLVSMVFGSAVRSAVRLVGSAVVASWVGYVIRPWAGVVRLGATLEGTHVSVRAVSTGVLPIRLADAHGGPSVRLVDGQVGTVSLAHRSAGGGYGLTASLGLGGWGWASLVVICLLPTLWSCTVGLNPGHPPPADDVVVEPPRPVPIGVPA